MKRIYLFAILLLAFSVYMGCKKDEENFNCGETFTDPRDGKNYNTVIIGNQCWMAENLNLGTMINGIDEMTDNGVVEKYCYKNDPANCDEYGGLYQWNEMMEYTTIAGIQGICPSNWHLPTDLEWTTLTDFLGGESIAGGEMKETDITHWKKPNTGATNESEFTALPSGYCGAMGYFHNLGKYCTFWTSTEGGTLGAWGRRLSYGNDGVYRGSGDESYGYSVRCLKD